MQPASTTYGVREVAALLGVSPARVRAFARAGLVEARRGRRGELRFGFRELALLRRVRELSREQVNPRRVRDALLRLRAALPPERDLCELGLSAAAGELVVRDRGRMWSAESGQLVFDFERAPGPCAARERRVVALARPGASEEQCDPESWYRLGCELEESDPARARAAYERALALSPDHADAHVNLGCLDHEAGRLDAAEAHYRAALASRPNDAVARFDLAVVLEDRGELEAARDAYLACLAADPSLAEAHFNLARLAQRAGDAEAVLRHLAAYRRLCRD